MATLQQVLALAKRGVPVFPLQPGTKDHFLNKLSDHGATTDASEVFDTFRGRDLNFGCWTATRLVIIDIDAGKGGIEAWEELLKEIGPVPRTLTVRSARGGLHIYFWANGELFGSADLVLGKLNVRGVNGYVVGPGCTFRDPDTGIIGRYEIVEDCDIQPVPDNLRQRLQLRELNTAGPTVASNLDTPAAIAQARARLQWAPPAIQGQSGDATTIKTANAVLDYGLTTDTAHALMLELWNPRCLPPWDADELKVKVENAWNYRTGSIGRDMPSEGFAPMPPHMLRALTTIAPPTAPALITATPYRWTDPAAILPREWLYGRHLIRKFVSCTVAPGGVGKSSLKIAEGLSYVTGRQLLNEAVTKAGRVWLWNGEDPYDELQRRIQAACLHYGITYQDY